MMSAFMRNGGKVRADELPREIKRDEMDFAPPQDLDPYPDPEPRVVIDMNRLTDDIRNNRVSGLRALLLSLTFGEKMEFSEGVTEILLRNCPDAKDAKLDSFILAMSMHLWAKGEDAEDKKTATQAVQEQPVTGGNASSTG